MSTNLWISLAAASAALVLQAGCNGTECADGTIEQNGFCVPATDDPSDSLCGEGTVLGDSGFCEPAMPPTVCGENTIEDTEQEPGVITCVGQGGPSDCNSNLACPGAASGKVTVCGRLFDVQTDTRILAAAPTFADCDLANPAAEGPCHVKITFYDALDFAGNPTGATPLQPQNFRLDDCGRYVAENINRPSLGFLGIATDNANAPEDLRLTGVAFPVTSGQVRNNQQTYVVTQATNVAWSTDPDVGFTAANGFIDRGVFMPLFRHGTVPVAGVTVTSNGSVRAADDYYFTDTDPSTRLDTTPTGPTGVNGAALLLNSSLVEHSGTGGEPAGCVWPSDLAASIPGVLFLNPRIAETSTGAECP
jgi:hypothetical protein